MFKGKFLKVENPEAPSSLKWQNQTYSEFSRGCRSGFVWVLTVGIVIGAFYAMVIFKNYNDSILAGFDPNLKCPSDPISPDLALEDWDKPPK